MKVLMVCSELAPLAKTGGLADAVTGLANALTARGHDVRVLLPHYSHLPPAKTTGFTVPVAGRLLRCHAIDEPADGRRLGPRIYLLDLEELTTGRIYAGDARDAGRFMWLSAAALALPNALGWQPDVLHCHDWHTALVPVLQRVSGNVIPSVLTLHNVGYQGVFDVDVLEQYGFPQLRTEVEADVVAGSVNFLRAGVRTASVVTTVSPTYAEEIRTPAFGMGLEDLLSARGADLIGILNGVEYDVWSPATDPYIDVHYDAANLDGKHRLKGALSIALGLAQHHNAPLIGLISRLVPQKGIDLFAAALPTLLRETHANFALLGSGDATLATELHRLANTHPRRLSFTDGYDEALAHRLFAAGDLTLVPSRYEPCGLTQMYALRYGTVPVVRATGGLADTIEHYDPATGRGNGSVFRDADPEGLLWGVRTALGWFDTPRAWSRIVANGMAADFSWQKQVGPYEQLYRALV